MTRLTVLWISSSRTKTAALSNNKSCTSNIIETSSVCLNCVRFQMEQDAAEDTQAQAGKVGREQAIHGCGRTNWEQALVNSKFYSWCSGREVMPYFLTSKMACFHKNGHASDLTNPSPVPTVWRRWSHEGQRYWKIWPGMTRTVILLNHSKLAGGYKWHIGIFWWPRPREWDNWDNSYNLMVSLCILVQASKMAPLQITG